MNHGVVSLSSSSAESFFIFVDREDTEKEARVLAARCCVLRGCEVVLQSSNRMALKGGEEERKKELRNKAVAERGKGRQQ